MQILVQELADNLDIKKGTFITQQAVLDVPQMIKEVVETHGVEAERARVELVLNQPSLQVSP